MEFNQQEVKLINQALRLVNQWHWYKFGLIVSLMLLVYFYYFLFTSDNYTKHSSAIAIAIGWIIGYLVRNWSGPQQEKLLLRLVWNQKKSKKSSK